MKQSHILFRVPVLSYGSDSLITGTALFTYQIKVVAEGNGAKLKEIGERFGISDAAVSQASRRVAVKAETDQQLKKMLDQVETLLRNVKS